MRLLLVDDHPLVREGTALLLKKLSRNMQIVEAGNGRQALERLQQDEHFQMLLIDLGMPDMDGFDLLAELGGSKTQARLVVLSACEDLSTIARVRALGAHAFIHKSLSPAEMLEAVQRILDGAALWPQGLDNAVEPLKLTDRQISILRALRDGKSNRQIAEQLHISEHTVKFHLATLYRLLNAANRTECMSKAQSHGLI